jgi:general secretion pathway protein G
MDRVQAATLQRGFTFIEVLATLAIIAVLTSVCLPLAELSAQRQKETELRIALRELRNALDEYRRAGDEGRIVRRMGDSGYPPNLETLVAGAEDAKSPKGNRIYFLRRIPRDPLFGDPSVPAEQTWGKRSYASAPDAPREGEDVFDVYSLSTGAGFNGVRYREW